jgi:hypothetical protein
MLSLCFARIELNNARCIGCVETTGVNEEFTQDIRAHICRRDVLLQKTREQIVVTMDRHLLNAVHQLNSPSGPSMVE